MGFCTYDGDAKVLAVVAEKECIQGMSGNIKDIWNCKQILFEVNNNPVAVDMMYR